MHMHDPYLSSTFTHTHTHTFSYTHAHVYTHIQVEKESIMDYVSESENLAHLHMKVSAADALLASIQGTLGTFQTDLGKVGRF